MTRAAAAAGALCLIAAAIGYAALRDAEPDQIHVRTVKLMEIIP